MPPRVVAAVSSTAKAGFLRELGADDVVRYEEDHQLLWRLRRTGLPRAAVHAELPLTQASTAHRIIESRSNHGKVVLRP